MAKGGMVDQFEIGEHVSFATADNPVRTGRIVKLHRSTATGVAEIKPDDGSKKVARRLMHVRKTGWNQ